MANPKKLSIQQIPAIRASHGPHLANALQEIVEYINKNVTPVAGDAVSTRKGAPGNS